MNFEDVHTYTKTLTLLYVEDEADVRDSTALLLQNYFHEVILAKNGEEGLLLYEASLKSKPFDIVMTDVNMPRLSGIDMVKQIKALFAEQSVIFISAHQEKDFLLEAIKLGVNYYIIKPLGSKELSTVLYEVAQNISNKRSVQKQLEEEQKRVQKNERYKKALEYWSGVDLKHNESSLKEATKLSAQTLDIERVSVWIFDAQKETLVCQDLYSLKDDSHTSGMSLEKSLYPRYFDAVSSNTIVAIEDARNDTRTMEFKHSYLEPLGIYAMLEIPLLQDNQLIGVVCHEETKGVRQWDIDEQKFCLSLANNISLSFEIKKRHEIQEMLDYQAHHDQLTGLPNRTLFMDRLFQSIKQNKRNQTKLALLFIDLDNFKQINDSLGHDAGDEVLKIMAKRLLAKIRDSDTLARLGGDEFTLILNDIVDDNTVVDIVEKLLQVTQEVMEISSEQFYATFSIGISIYPNDGESVEDLLKNADAAMYKAKESGRNNYEYYTQEMTEKAMRRVKIEADLRKAIENEEFLVYYQPQIEASDGSIIGMEALVRWNHPQNGLISPVEFIPLAEETGFIIEIDKFVMQDAMKQVLKWRNEGLYRGKLSLNLSMVMLDCDTFIAQFPKLLQEIGFNPAWLELEITEGHIMKNPQKAVNTLNEIRRLGIAISIDDFGTGYSSLAYLKKLPVSKLKIDKSFVDGLPLDEDDSAITRTIIDLAKNLKLDLIAEGVENAEQRDFLLQNSCSKIQGYFYSKPLCAQDMHKKLLELE
jgi:diguanylate cyclase (GGDEF)-like protein